MMLHPSSSTREKSSKEERRYGGEEGFQNLGQSTMVPIQDVDFFKKICLRTTD